ncbi:hypothetical protein [Sphingobium abikonense]|jgi:hypothetical protein|uniref:hypothetical protein n=1 Tax=Sphingobium abikonense TaxID=86193 RepID=UPI0012ED0402|nr:hypothetical protein [Sphingobium abikonense]
MAVMIAPEMKGLASRPVAEFALRLASGRLDGNAGACTGAKNADGQNVTATEL